VIRDLAGSLESWLHANATWAPLVIFVITFLESLPGISLLVPAIVLLLVIGVLLGNGTLDLGLVLVAAVAGAILGDAVGFWVSRAVGARAVRRWLPRRQRRSYARALLLFRRWGWAAVFLGRFLGPVRAVAPAVAGIARMREWQFQTANVASAVIWAPVMLLPGFSVARGAEQLALPEGNYLIGVAMLVTGGGWILVRYTRRRLIQQEWGKHRL
jgi:membrane protein DedA with SNARE-associated domain